ncbi:MAG: SRPBCC family protein, partial [Myxococcota bacterium]
SRIIAYTAYEGLPGFVREGGNTWRVVDLGDETEVRMNMRFDLNPVADLFMGWMLKRQMGKAATDVLADLKAYVETGRVSQAKRIAQQQRAA